MAVTPEKVRQTGVLLSEAMMYCGQYGTTNSFETASAISTEKAADLLALVNLIKKKLELAGALMEVSSSVDSEARARITALEALRWHQTTVTVNPADWNSTSKTATCTVTGVTSTGLVIVSPNEASRETAINSELFCSAHGTNSITLKCANLPATAVTVVVAYAEVAS